MRLSKNFTLDEFTRSEKADQLGINNQPNLIEIERIRSLTDNLAQPLRDMVGLPVVISSGFRSAALNRVLRGRPNSQHRLGEAMDFEVPGMDNRMVAELIRQNFTVDQLILEFYVTDFPSSGWIHVSYVSTRPNRNQWLTASRSAGGGVQYRMVSAY